MNFTLHRFVLHTSCFMLISHSLIFYISNETLSHHIVVDSHGGGSICSETYDEKADHG